MPDGTYQLGSTMWISFKCIPPCLTNRALRFDQVSSALRRAAMLADLALRPESPKTMVNDSHESVKGWSVDIAKGRRKMEENTQSWDGSPWR